MSNLKFITVLYGAKPDAYQLPDQELIKDPTQTEDNIDRYTLKESRIKVYCFQGTITSGTSNAQNNEYLAVQMSLPAVFFNSSSTQKFKYTGIFLISPISINVSPSNGDHGIYNCPIPIGMGRNSIYTKKHEDATDECFRYLKEFYYPLLLPSWQIYFYVTERPHAHLNIDDGDPELNGNERFTFTRSYINNAGKEKSLHLLTGDEPVSYNTTLGIFCSRKVGVLNMRTKSRVKS